jgi:hypothetical protein
MGVATPPVVFWGRSPPGGSAVPCSGRSSVTSVPGWTGSLTRAFPCGYAKQGAPPLTPICAKIRNWLHPVGMGALRSDMAGVERAVRPQAEVPESHIIGMPIIGDGQGRQQSCVAWCVAWAMNLSWGRRVRSVRRPIFATTDRRWIAGRIGG